MIINNNIPALNTYRQMGINQNAQQSAMEKLSSGLRINRAGDDAAGLAISEKMRTQIRGLDQASRNAQDGISMIQTAEGALDETHSILQRMRELATQAANDTNVEVDREEIQKEINQLTSEINRIGNTTEFNTQKLLDGGAGQTSGGSFHQVTATDNLGNEFAGDSATIEINGVSVTLDEDYAGAQAVVDLLNDEFDGTGVSFSLVDDELVITSAEEFTVNVSGDGAGAINISDDTEAELNVPDGLDFAAGGGGFSATFQIGANQGQSMTIEIADMRASALGIAGTAGTTADGFNEDVAAGGVFSADNNVTNGTDNNPEEAALSVLTHEDASAAVEAINQAIEEVSSQRSELGAFQNRLEHTISNLDNASENLSAAESRIRDVDYANAA